MTLSFFDDDDERQQTEQRGVSLLREECFRFEFSKTRTQTSDMISFASASSCARKARVLERKGLQRTPENTLFLLFLLLLSSGATKNSFRGALKALLFLCGFEVIFFPFDERRAENRVRVSFVTLNCSFEKRPERKGEREKEINSRLQKEAFSLS